MKIKKKLKKVCVVITARTSYTKMKTILQELTKIKEINLKIICAASAVSENYGNIENQIIKDDLKIDYKIHSLLDDKSLNSSTKSVALGIIQFADIFFQMKPDMVLIMADRYEIISPVISASYQNIPIAHIQGGEISGNIDEKVRHAVTKFSDYHFPSTKKAYNNLIKMGEDKNKIFYTGCPSIDIAKKINKVKKFNFDIYKKYRGVGDIFKFQPKSYLIIMYHPDTNELENIEKSTKDLIELIKFLNLNVYWFWPNADAGSNKISKIIRRKREASSLSKIHFFKNMEPEDFLVLLNNSIGIIGNSSAGVRESSYFGTPSINIGNRQIGREKNQNVLDIKILNNKKFSLIKRHLKKNFKSSYLYGSGNAGIKIAKIIKNINYPTFRKIFIS
ncbi:UDP-N-acetylglucosamine 2-epimerase [Pelagibacteraceae bacterium]|nr:UDP-N-acetylglucosamine 2-epimerase [Pelagibacteraceae bacterium]